MMINVFLLVIGCFVDNIAAVIILTPILLPVVTQLGIDPVHFGVIMMTTLTSGIMTPPVGIALYSTSEIMGCTPQETVKEAIPFYITLFALIVVLVLFPQIVLFLPNRVFG